MDLNDYIHKPVVFKNNTNTDILVTRIYMDNAAPYFVLNTDNTIPGGGQVQNNNLHNDLNTTNGSTGNWLLLKGHGNTKYPDRSGHSGATSDGYQPMVWTGNGAVSSDCKIGWTVSDVEGSFNGTQTSFHNVLKEPLLTSQGWDEMTAIAAVTRDRNSSTLYLNNDHQSSKSTAQIVTEHGRTWLKWTAPSCKSSYKLGYHFSQSRAYWYIGSKPPSDWSTSNQVGNISSGNNASATVHRKKFIRAMNAATHGAGKIESYKGTDTGYWPQYVRDTNLGVSLRDIKPGETVWITMTEDGGAGSGWLFTEYVTTPAANRWVADKSGNWPTVYKHSTHVRVHPQKGWHGRAAPVSASTSGRPSNNKDIDGKTNTTINKKYQASHRYNVVRYVAPNNGIATVTARVLDDDGGGEMNGVRALCTHIKTSKVQNPPDPSNFEGEYLDVYGWSYLNGVGWYRNSCDNKVQSVLLSNWHPEKHIYQSNGMSLGSGNLRNWITDRTYKQRNPMSGDMGSYRPSEHDWMIKGNTNRNTLVETYVSGPVFNKTSDAQADSTPLRARYVRWYPVNWHTFASARVGLYNSAKGWNLGLDVPDNRITANDNYPSSVLTAPHSRLNTNHAWAVRDSSSYKYGEHWIQYDLGSVQDIERLGSKGRGDADQWVTWFVVFASDDGNNWTLVSPDMGGEFVPDGFQKKVNVSKGDFIDMYIEAGPGASNYDTTRVDFDVKMQQIGSGVNGNLTFDSQGYVVNATTGSKSGIRLEKHKTISIDVYGDKTPAGRTPPKNHTDTSVVRDLKVDYSCDNILESGGELFDNVDSTRVEITSSPGQWYTIKSKITGRGFSGMFTTDLIANSPESRWLFLLDLTQWAYLAPSVKPFDQVAGDWWFLAPAIGSTGNGKWCWFYLDSLPIMYASGIGWLMMFKEGAAKMSTAMSGDNKTLTFKYTIYDYSTWVASSTKSYTVTGPATSPKDPDLYKKFPPDHSRAGLTPIMGHTNSEWWQPGSAPGNPPSLDQSGAYRQHLTQKFPCKWIGVADIHEMPNKVSVLGNHPDAFPGSQKMKWVVLTRYDDWKSRKGKRPVWRSSDGKVELSYADNISTWSLSANGITYLYKLSDANTVERKFPADGSYMYQNTSDLDIPRSGDWKLLLSGNTPSDSEHMLYFIWKEGETFNPSDRVTSYTAEYSGRPDMRPSDVSRDNGFPYDENQHDVTAFQYRHRVQDNQPTRGLNSRLFLIIYNTEGSEGGPKARGFLTRDIHGVHFSKVGLDGDLWMGNKMIYPGKGSVSYSEGSFHLVHRVPVPRLRVLHQQSVVKSNIFGFIIAGCEHNREYGYYMDCGYDTKQTLVLEKNDGTFKEISPNTNLRLPNGSNTPDKSQVTFLGTVVGSTTNPYKTPGAPLRGMLTSGDYTLKHYNFGGQNVSGLSPVKSIPVNIGNTNFSLPPFSSYLGLYDDDFDIYYGGTRANSPFMVRKQCCDNISRFPLAIDPVGTKDVGGCIDLKTPVLNDPAQIMRRDARGTHDWEVVCVRYCKNTGSGQTTDMYRDGPIRWHAGSGRYSGGSWPFQLSEFDNGGPTYLKFNNKHPFSRVIMRVRARVAMGSNDQCGMQLKVSSDTRGVIWDPVTISSYLAKGGWPYTFKGGTDGAVSPGSSTGVSTGKVTGGSAVGVNGGSASHQHTLDFGYWTFQPGETIEFQLCGATNVEGHGGWGELEGSNASWIEMTVHDWPDDPN